MRAKESLRARSRLRTPHIHLLDVLVIQGLPTNICQHLSVRDVLSLSSVSKVLHTWLMDEVSASIWKVTVHACIMSASNDSGVSKGVSQIFCDSFSVDLQGVYDVDVAPGYLASLPAESSRHARAAITNALAAKHKIMAGMPPQRTLTLLLADRQNKSRVWQLVFSACGQYLAVSFSTGISKRGTNTSTRWAPCHKSANGWSVPAHDKSGGLSVFKASDNYAELLCIRGDSRPPAISWAPDTPSLSVARCNHAGRPDNRTPAVFILDASTGSRACLDPENEARFQALVDRHFNQLHWSASGQHLLIASQSRMQDSQVSGVISMVYVRGCQFSVQSGFSLPMIP